MEIKEILESKENLISFLKSQGFKEEVSYKDREYKGVVFLKIGEKKLLAVCEAFSEEKIKEIKNHFLIDRGLTHVAIFFRDKIIFYRNYGERRYFIYSKRTADNISKINKLKKIGENFDVIFQTKDISGTFYEQFKLKRDLLVRAIKNNIEPVKKYLIAQKIFDRIFFIYFLCHKKIVRFDDGRELSGKVFFDILIENGDFIENLRKAFTLFNTPHKNNILKIGNYKIKIPYLNGGLFREAEEEKDLKISLKKSDWQRIFEFLNSYHWIIESEVEELTEEIEEEEAKILTPEILGHVYERSVIEWELKGFKKEVEDATKGVSERKKKGVYYTPEEITDYICKNTIYPYLLDNLGNKYKDINEFLEKATISDIKKALKVLDEIKVLDPACGSGAFLLKAGEVLFYLKTALLNKLGKKTNYYEIKHSIITENLYGVDILEGAIEIAKLRLWLWLVSSYKEEKEIQALPNIEYNLVVGNSLIGWVNEKLTQITLTNPMTPEIEGIFRGLIANSIYEKEELQKAKELLEKTNLEGYIEAYYILYTIYKKAHGERAVHLKEILQTIRDAIYKSINQAFLNYINKKIKPNHKLTDPPIKLEDFEALKPFHWRVDFGHIIKKGGFDIVIGNPPYVSKHNKENTLPASQQILFCEYTSAFKDSDLYCYFLERSNTLTHADGYVGMITSNTFFVSVFGSPLRALLSQKHIKRIIDFKEFEVFEDASNYVQIIIYKNIQVKDRNIIYCAKPLYLDYHYADIKISEAIEDLERSLRERYPSNRKIKKKLVCFPFSQDNLLDRVLLKDNGKLEKIPYSTNKSGIKIEKEIPVSDIWVILPENLLSIHNKIDSSSEKRLYKCEIIRNNRLIKINDFVSEGIFVGVQTSADNVYILKSIEDIDLESWTKKKKIKVNPQRDSREFYIETGILKAFVKPDMLDRFTFNWEKMFVIFPYKKDASLLTPTEIKSNYPLAWIYLTSKETLLQMIEQSKDREKLIDSLMKKLKLKNLDELSDYLSKNPIDKLPETLWWYRYIYPKNLKSVNKPKVLTKTVSNINSFSLDLSGLTAPHNVGVYSIPLKEKFYYILGLLNSEVCQFYLTSFLPDKRGGYFLFIKEYLSLMPIIFDREDEITDLVKQIITAKENGEDTVILEKKMNDIFYEIYGLSNQKQLIKRIIGKDLKRN